MIGDGQVDVVNQRWLQVPFLLDNHRMRNDHCYPLGRVFAIDKRNFSASGSFDIEITCKGEKAFWWAERFVNELLKSLVVLYLLKSCFATTHRWCAVPIQDHNHGHRNSVSITAIYSLRIKLNWHLRYIEQIEIIQIFSLTNTHPQILSYMLIYRSKRR